MSLFGSRRGWMNASALALAAALSPAAVHAQVAYDFNLPAQPLADSLRAVGSRAGVNVAFDPAATRGRRAEALKGSYAVSDALAQLVAGTGLEVRGAAGGSFLVVRDAAGPQAQGALAAPQASETADVAQLSELTVTGTRIRGAPPTSPMISITAEDFKNAGHSDLGEVVRALPQNFSGGQNPGIGLGQEGTGGGQNLNGASQLNLRGLGSDATLTLLNGHRLAYDGVKNGVDISAIPTIAVARLEVLTDGASALYGSDAVGGVANVILKRDVEGLTTSARMGGATSGGDLHRQFSAIAGTKWASGGVMLAVQYEDRDEIQARQRSITRALNPLLSLTPDQEVYSAVVTAQQALGDGVTASIDGVYSRRKSDFRQPYTNTLSYLVNGFESFADTEAVFVGGSVRAGLGEGWTSELLASYARDDALRTGTNYSNGAFLVSDRFGGLNTTKVLEAIAEGPLFATPGGQARLALGAGYRRNSITATRAVILTKSRSSQYAYGEMYVPLVSPSAPAMGLEGLSFTAAARFEDYGDLGGVFTPKLGLIVSPSLDFDVKGSWGRSFKAPALALQYDGVAAAVRTAAAFGGRGYAPTATAIGLTGGDAALGPERAESGVVTVSVHPRNLDRLTVDVSYFRIKYTDRIVRPIAALTAYLGNATYVRLVDTAVTPADVAAALALTTTGIPNNLSGRPFSPTDVVAIVDNRLRNAARQDIEGADVLATYDVATSGAWSLSLSGSATYIDTRQQLFPDTPTVQLSGTIYNLPKVRARLGANAQRGAFRVSSYVNYTGSLDDTRFTPSPKIKAQATWDLGVGYAPQAGALLEGLEVRLDVANILNTRPDTIRGGGTFVTPYDSTNFSVVGRVVSLSVTKAW